MFSLDLLALPLGDCRVTHLRQKEERSFSDATIECKTYNLKHGACVFTFSLIKNTIQDNHDLTTLKKYQNAKLLDKRRKKTSQVIYVNCVC